METKTEYFGNFKRVLFRGKDGLWHIKECSCTRRSVCAVCREYSDCGLMPDGIGPLVAFTLMVILLFVLLYSLMFLESIVPYK